MSRRKRKRDREVAGLAPETATEVAAEPAAPVAAEPAAPVAASPDTPPAASPDAPTSASPEAPPAASPEAPPSAPPEAAPIALPPIPRVPSIDPNADPIAMGPELEPVELDSLAPEVGGPPGDRRRGPRFNFLTGTLLLAAVALLGGYLAVNLILMPSLTRQGAEVRVPEVIGFSEREAERLLAAEDLKLSKISEQWSPDVPRGFITAQDPTAGGIVKRGRRISVIVSLGAQGTSVPILDGVTARQAEILLEGAGLKMGRTASAYSEQVSKDLIIASDPPGETVVEQETSVDLLVSLGPLPRAFVLPDLTGRDAVSAARSLRDVGFYVSLREGGSRQKNGLVSGQDPASGHRVAPRDSLVLYYHP